MNLTTRLLDRQQSLTIDPKRTAIVIVDPWDCHWCMTTAARSDSRNDMRASSRTRPICGSGSAASSGVSRRIKLAPLS